MAQASTVQPNFLRGSAPKPTRLWGSAPKCQTLWGSAPPCCPTSALGVALQQGHAPELGVAGSFSQSRPSQRVSAIVAGRSRLAAAWQRVGVMRQEGSHVKGAAIEEAETAVDEAGVAAEAAVAAGGAALPAAAGGGVSGLVKGLGQRAVTAVVDLLYRPSGEKNLILEGNFGPVEEWAGGVEVAVEVVAGAVPEDFPTGTYVRNGPNPVFPLPNLTSPFGRTSHHWFEGDGFLHAVHFTGGPACSISYVGRQVDTEGLRLEKAAGRPLWLGIVGCDVPALVANALFNQLRFGQANKNWANTSIVSHAGRALALMEGGLPHVVSLPDLTTQGMIDFDATWQGPFTAHPKVDPVSGEMFTFGFDPAKKPHLTIGTIAADGKLTHKTTVDLERCPYMHDIGITEKYLVILDLPLTFDSSRIPKGEPIIAFDHDGYARMGVMPRGGVGIESVRWFTVKSCFCFHLFNAYEDGDEIVIHGARQHPGFSLSAPPGMSNEEYVRRIAKPTDDGATGLDGSGLSYAYEWRLSLETGLVTEGRLTHGPVAMDFPRINDSYTGRKQEFGYAMAIDGNFGETGLPRYAALLKIQFPVDKVKDGEVRHAERIERLPFGANKFGTEFTFVGRPGSEEEDGGWVVGYVHNEEEETTELWIVDAKHVPDGPVARIALPQRIPYGFHGNFLPAN